MRPAIQDFGAVDAVGALAAIILVLCLGWILDDPCSPIGQGYLGISCINPLVASDSNDLDYELGTTGKTSQHHILDNVIDKHA